MDPTPDNDTLASRLAYQPVELKFGTSGRRGLLVHLTQLEIYLNSLAELEFLLSLPAADGGITKGDPFFVAADLRPSSTQYDPAHHGRGEIAQAILRAVHDAGMSPVYLGFIPTPALAAFAFSRGKGSIMVTGSHIPFDRNGYKTNTSRGELLKHHEAPIAQSVARVRARLLAQPWSASPFDELGRFKSGAFALPPVNDDGRDAYLRRYTDFFPPDSLSGLSILFYQHSAVGRDLVPAILESLGARVHRAGRSDAFVPIDTENIDAPQLAAIQSLLDQSSAHGPFHAVISTDGDSDRPLILGVDPNTSHVRFFPGDLAGIVTAQYLHAGAVVVPISCNDAIDLSALAPVLQPKTRIGSPYVIAGMEQALARGCRNVCGWEANGGFLTGSPIELDHRTLAPLPTRDAVLPILAVLASAQRRPLHQLFDALPPRHSRAALLPNFPRSTALRILERLTADPALIPRFFTPELGFSSVAHTDSTDGLRITFLNGDVAHIRPSGNADELRIYAVADSPARAEAITASGILRSLERALA
ncbi:MAG: phosphomannomutase [Candidatus Solibacter usitatus]|nr:phosphomannomutase [Candidatus Solibacter usitatus]